MEQKQQDKYRESITEKYEQRAWECLGLYRYWGQKFQNAEAESKRIEGFMEKAEAEIRDIEAKPDHHTVENKERVKALKKDCEKYEDRLKGMGEPLKSLFEKAAGYQTEATNCLEIVDTMRDFKLNTPEEIAAKKVEAKAAEEAKS